MIRRKSDDQIPAGVPLPEAVPVPVVVRPVWVAEERHGGTSGIEVFHPGLTPATLAAFVRHLQTIKGWRTTFDRLKTMETFVDWHSASAEARQASEATAITELQAYLTGPPPFRRWMRPGHPVILTAGRYDPVQSYVFQMDAEATQLIVSLPEPSEIGWARADQVILGRRLCDQGLTPLRLDRFYFTVNLGTRKLSTIVEKTRLALSHFGGDGTELRHIAIQVKPTRSR